MPKPKLESIWTRAFALLCLAEFLGYAQHFVLQPTFRFTLLTLAGRFYCRTGDRVLRRHQRDLAANHRLLGRSLERYRRDDSRLLTQTLSNLICFIPLAGATMIANGFRGIGWSGMNTGGYTLLATAAPADRRGEASGYYGGVQSTATICFRPSLCGSSRLRAAVSTRCFSSP